MITFFEIVLSILSPAMACLFASRGLIHYFQLESYQFPGYFNTLIRNVKRAMLPGVMLAGLLFALFVATFPIFDVGEGLVQITVLFFLFLFSAIGGWWIGKLFQDKKAKKALAITPRVKRLYGALFLVCALIAWALKENVSHFLPLILMPILLPLFVALAGLLAWPLEKLISEYYFCDARKKLTQMDNLIRIGITGSYGKTSVKFILGTILGEKYSTFMTPASYNTPMGVTRAIRESLTPSHRVFIAEMGARHVGDIKEMCRLVRPTFGILTSVGPQHLETFKTIERITKTKYELIEALPEDGYAVFPDDEGICKALYEKTALSKALVAMNHSADVFATEVKATPQGSTFVLNTKDGAYPCKTKLLGEHNIQNILLAAAMALKIGLTPLQVASGIAKIEPVAHRLQIVPSGNGMTIIDDAFNSNPVGASAALKVLKSFEGRRIIITPGMVELGEKEAEYNHAFGLQMASAVDVAILIGKKHAQPIVDGLNEGGFAKENLYRAQNLDESTVILQKIMRAGDVILYENDLPDNYNDA